MAQCRLLLDDVIQQATLTAAGTAAGMDADRLKTDPKGEACRILSGSGQIVATWAQPVTVGAIVIPACNLGPSSTIRVRAYQDAAGSTLLADTGTQLAAPGAILGLWSFSQPLNVNAFSEGAALVCAYLPQHEAVRRIVIDLADPGATFLDLSKLVVGPYLQVEYGAAYGAQTAITDMSSNARAASGDIKTDWAPRAKKVTFSLDWVAEADRARVLSLFKAGVGKWLFADLLCGTADPVTRQDYQIYGKAMQSGGMSYHTYRFHSASFDIEGY